MLSDKQSLILCGVIAGVIFVTGVLDLLNNFLIKTVLAILFLTIIVNFFYVRTNRRKNQENTIE